LPKNSELASNPRTSKSFDRFIDEPEHVGVLDQRSYLGALKATRHFGFDLKPELNLATRQCGELLDNRLDNLMDVPRRPLRLAKESMDANTKPLAEGLQEEAYLFQRLIREPSARTAMARFL
jgi:hypothetical protein